MRREAQGGSSLVLSFVLSPRYVGFVALDEHGLVERGARIVNVRAAGYENVGVRRLRGVLAHVLARADPSVIVIGRSQHPRANPCSAMYRTLLREARRTGTPVTVRPTMESRRVFLGRSRQRRPTELATLLTCAFVPALRDLAFRQSIGQIVYRANMWTALGLAIIELARRHSYAAVAITEISAPRLPGLEALIRTGIGELQR